MNFTALSIESILHEYERLRLANRRLRDDRQEEIYAKIPEIKTLEETSKFSRLELMKKRVSQGVSSHDIPKTKEKIQELLTSHGYPKNYLEPIYSCKRCEDTGYMDGMRCECFSRRIVRALYRQSNLTRVLEKENFDTFSLSYYKNEPLEGSELPTPYENAKNILERCREFTRRFEETERERGNILISGQTGLGKTFLTNCIARELLERGHTVLYLSANDLFEQLLGDYLINKNKRLEELYRYLYDSELLIIDDLGTETTNSFVNSQLFEIVNQRGLQGLSTILSTNLDMKKLHSRYSDRIMSRIVANYAVYLLYGDNIRYQKRKQAGLVSC